MRAALILFCTESTEADPLKRTGIPLRRNQKVLIDQGVAKVVPGASCGHGLGPGRAISLITG